MANVNVVIHTDSCTSRTGSVGTFQYWLGTTLTLWLEPPGGAWAQLEPDTVKLLAAVLSPWRWKQADWWFCDDRATDAAIAAVAAASPPLPPPPQHPQSIDVGELKTALDTQLQGKFADPPAFDWLTTPAPVQSGDPPWALRLMHLSRTPAPIPHKLGLTVVHPLPGPPAAAAKPAAAVYRVILPGLSPGPGLPPGPDIVLVLGQPYAQGPDSITLTATGMPPAVTPPPVASPPISFVVGSPQLSDMDKPIGLVMGLSRLTDTTGETTRNWLGDLGPRLGRALHPWMRLADLVSGDYGAGTWTQGGVEAAATRALWSLFADLTKLNSRTLALMAGVNPFNPQSVEKRFLSEWVNALSAPSVTAGQNVLQKRLADSTAMLLARTDASKWSARLFGAYATADQRDTLKSLLTSTLPDPNNYGADVLTAKKMSDAVGAWLANVRNMESLFSNLAPTRTAGLLFGALAQSAATSSRDDFDQIKTDFAGAFCDALKAAIGPLETTDPVIRKLGQSLWPSLFEAPAVLEPAAESGLALRADTVFLADTDKLIDPHRLHDGYVLAVRRTKAGLSGAMAITASMDQLISGLQSTDWGAPSICTRADISVGSTVWQSLITPLPVSFDRANQVDASQSEVRNAIVTYYGNPLIPANKPDPSVKPNGASAPVHEINLSYAGPTAGVDVPELAFGQIYQARCAYLAPGGVVPQGWGTDISPWDTSQLATTFDAVDTGITNAGAAVLTSPKSFVLLRQLPSGPPRLLSTPNEPDGARLAEMFGKTGDPQVRPLWRERMRTWNELDRARLYPASTCFLDAEKHTAPQQVTFWVRAPALPLGDNAQGSLAARTWRYWTQRDADAGDVAAQKRIQTVFDTSAAGDLHRDDPAVIYPPRSSNTTGGCFATLLELDANGVTQKKQLALRFSEAQPFAPVTVVRDESATSADMVHDSGGSVPGLKVTIPPGGLFALSFQTFIDPGFFGGGVDPRLSTKMLPGANQAAPDWAVAPAPPVPIDGVVGYGFAESLIAFEALPADDHLPDPLSLWNAISLSNSGSEVFADFAPAPPTPAFDYVGQVTAWRQTWAWDGGPVDDGVLTVYASPVETVSGIGRGRVFKAFESDMFSSRGLAGGQSVAHHTANAASTRLFSIVRPANVGADYMRVRIEAQSRYAALRSTPPSAQAKAAVSSDAEGAGLAADKWRAIALPLQRVAALPTPKPRVAIPLFGAVNSADAVTGGFAVLLDEPAYDVARSAGLAEQLVAEIVVEQLTVQVDDTGAMSAGTTLALAVGMDATLAGGDGDPYTGAGTRPVRIVRQPVGASAGIAPVRFVRAVVLGETLEPESAAPLMPYATALFEPAFESTAGAGAQVRPGTMALVRLRVEAFSTLPSNPSSGSVPAAPDVSSAWSAPLWIQFTPQADPSMLNQPSWSLSNGKLTMQIGAKPGAAGGVELFKRWRSLPTRPSTGPGPEGRLGAVVGLVVRDASNREVLRPRCYINVEVSATSDALALSANVTDLGGLSTGVLTTVFVQLLETQEFTEPSTQTIIPANLAARAAQWMNDAGQDALGRIIALGPRFFLEIALP